MRRVNPQVLLAVWLVAAFAAISFAHYLLFREARTLIFYLLLDLAFIPLQVLVVSLILDQLLSRREKRALLKKLNMVIGAFFSEVGNRLLGHLAAFHPDLERLRAEMLPAGQWTARDFDTLARSVAAREIRLDSARSSLASLKEYLAGRQDFILRLLENSNLLEHDSFAELLWSVLHVSEELAARPRLDGLPPADLGAPVGRPHPGLRPPAAGVDLVPPPPEGGLPLPVLTRRADKPLRPLGIGTRAGGRTAGRPAAVEWLTPTAWYPRRGARRGWEGGSFSSPSAAAPSCRPSSLPPWRPARA